ncbi:DNA-binding XRE family transcriptional regulator [Streptomyces sp. 846.5]|nr:helix-turn-helix transcriptional regulator [Streptomyces sp. 846.5]TDT93344.1 DNA-binding XRE family transcriptional regulator [Streptomyces sp. 846.5]
MREIEAGRFRPERARELRERAGLSRDELAVLARISPETVRSAEIGARAPSARVIRALADALRTTVDALCPPAGRVVLRDLRRRAGLTQRQLAEKVGVSAQMVSRVEAGVYGVKDPDRWAAGYKVTRAQWTRAWEAGRAARRKKLKAKGEAEGQCPGTSESEPQ